MPGIFSQGLSATHGLSNNRFSTRRQSRSSLESSSVASTSAGTYRSEGSSSSALDASTATSSKLPRYPQGRTNPFYSNKENSGAMNFRTMSSMGAAVEEEERRQQPSTTRRKQTSSRRKPLSRQRLAAPELSSDPLEEEWGYFVDCAEW